MSNKFKVYCTYKNDWDLNELSREIDFRANQNEILPREELLREVKNCDGLITNPRCRIDKEVLESAGSKLKVNRFLHKV